MCKRMGGGGGTALYHKPFSFPFVYKIGDYDMYPAY